MFTLNNIPDSLLESYDSHLDDEKVKSTRLFCILGLIISIVSPFIDPWAFSSILLEANIFKSVLMVLFGLIYWSTYRTFFINYCNLIQHVMCLIPALGLIYIMSLSAPTDTGHNIYFGFLILLIMVLFAWTYIPLYELVGNSLIIIVAYSSSIYVNNNVITNGFLNELIPSVFVMLSALCTGLIGRMINENHVRQSFLYSNSLKELADKQNYYANHDDLTGLSNRRSSEQLFQQDLNHAIKYNKLHFIMLLDLNYFKVINDDHGHQAGDAVLKVIAKRIKSCTRAEDHVCRIGGDEFAISLVVENNNTDIIKNIQCKITDSVTQPIKLVDQMLRVGISIGSASFPEDGNNIRLLLNIADERMYDNKYKQKQSDKLVSAKPINLYKVLNKTSRSDTTAYI